MKVQLKKYYSDGCGGLVSGVEGVKNAITAFEIPVANINMDNLLNKFENYGGSRWVWVLSNYIDKHGEIEKILIRVFFRRTNWTNNIPYSLEFDGHVTFPDNETFGGYPTGFMTFGTVENFKKENCRNLKDLSKMVNDTIGYLFNSKIELAEQK